MILATGAVVLAAVWLLIMPVYFREGMAKARQLAVKAIPTTLAALLAFAGLASGGFNDRYAVLVFAALCVCTAADVMLGVRFIVGGVLFLTGHVLYLTALGGFQTPTSWSFAVLIPAVLFLWLFCRRYLDRFPSKWLFAGVLVYCMALGLLLSFSLPLPFTAFSQRSVLAACGAFLFVLSDMGTCHAMLTPASRRFNYCSLGIYYTAQILLGLSAFGA